MRVVLLYGSDERQTEKIANYMADIIVSYGHQSFCLNIKYLPHIFDIRGYDRIVVGASIHAGQYQRYVIDWVHSNKNVLRMLPNAFYSVSMMASQNSREARQEVQDYIQSFVQESEWKPNHIASFGGALRFQEYSFFKKLLVKRVMSQKGIEVDIENNMEFTDWGGVTDFVTAFMQ